MDGLTTVLTCQASVQAGQVNHMSLAIADGTDNILDANVFLQAGSFIVVSTPTPSPTPSPTPLVTPSPSPTPTRVHRQRLRQPASPTATPTNTPSPTPTTTPTAAPTTDADANRSADAHATATAPSGCDLAGPNTGPHSRRRRRHSGAHPHSALHAEASGSHPFTHAVADCPRRSPAPRTAADITDGSAITGARVSGPRPEIVQSLILPANSPAIPDVILTNVALASLTMITILLSATMFNQTAQENSDDIEAFFDASVPFRAIGHTLNGIFNTASGNGTGFASVVAPFSILSLTALVYGFAEPGFGFNDKSLVLVASLIFGVGAVTYTYSGSQALLCRRGHGVPSGVKLFPDRPRGRRAGRACLARGELPARDHLRVHRLLRRLGAVTLDRRQMGQLVFIPGIILLGVCILAWFLVDPFRELAQDHKDRLAGGSAGRHAVGDLRWRG